MEKKLDFDNREIEKDELLSWYNMPKSRAAEEGVPSLWTIDNPRDRGKYEYFDMHVMMSEALEPLGMRICPADMPWPNMTLVQDANAYGLFRGDRTYGLNYHKPDLVTKEVLYEIRKTLATKPSAKGWRVIVLGGTEEPILVDAKTIAFWPAMRRESLDASLANVLKGEIERIDATEGANQRQLQWIAHLLKKNPPQDWNVNDGPRVIAVFDNYCGRKDSYCVWMLSGDMNHLPGWWPPKGLDEGLSSVCGLIVTHEFELLSYLVATDEQKKELFGMLEPVIIKTPKFTSKMEFEIRWRSSPRVEAKKKDENLPPKRVVVDLSGFEILSDQELKERLKELK